jgi:predicted nucleic acid-binding protein
VCGNRGLANEKLLLRNLREPGVGVLMPDEGTAHTYAALYRQLRVQGTPIPTNDLWIGALVVQHGLALATRDEHFRRLPQLQIV